jgi:PAS domain S-box-containing protein
MQGEAEPLAMDSTPLFPEAQAGAVADFLALYVAQFERIQAAALAQLLVSPELAAAQCAAELTAPFTTADARLGAVALGTRTLVERALTGEAAPYRAYLTRLAQMSAEAGVSLHATSELVCAFRRPLLPLVVERYSAEPLRLTAALQCMNDFADAATLLITRVYLGIEAAKNRAREEDLATTLDSIGDAVVVTDAAGHVVRMNPVAERLMAVSLVQCQGRPLDEVFRIENEDTGAVVESPVARVLREGTVVGLANHTVLVARDGTRLPIADSGAPVRHENGEIRGVVLVFRDVTEERNNEAGLRHWERIFQHATWGVAIASAPDVIFQAVNPAYAEMHGYTVAELQGQPVSTLWAPHTREDMERHAAETHQHGRLVAETTHLRKDGTALPVEVVATTIKDANGQVRWYVANVQDISERKRLQQSRVRAIELEAQNLQIVEANRLKSEFLANMSHELRTPLNSIIGFAELLHDEHVGAVAPKQREFLGEILGGGRHLLRLINEVLDLAKVEAGKMEFRPEPVELGRLVATVVQSLRATAHDKALSVDVSVHPDLDDIVLDPGRFKQVLYNYVSNALKFTSPGGQISVRVLPEGAALFRLEVEDTGIGIPPESVARLFTAFQQLDSGASKRHGGTGLGLALTKRLAEAQGGSVGMHPAAQGGSVFFAILPRRHAGYPRLKTGRSDMPKPTTILVIERLAKDRQTLLQILTSAGYQVDAVSDCSQALIRWQERAYDAITLDLLDGEDLEREALLQVVKNDARRPGVPIIAITLVGDQIDAEGFAVSDVLTRPVDATTLVRALTQGGVAPTRGRPVVIVDDDSGSLKLMEAMLGKLGYDALCFSDPREALAALEGLRPLAIILDLIMPEMDGLAFLERFRASPENRTVPVMIWTVKDLSLDERRGLQIAVHAVVQKGVDDSSRLLAALKSFFGVRKGAEGALR